MMNFNLHNPTRILFGQGRIADLTGQVPGKARILMTYGGGSIKNNGVYDQVKKALAEHTVLEFSGIEPNPSYETLMKAVEMVQSEQIDYLLAVGGGSVIDGTKFIAAAACFEGDPWEFMMKGGAGLKAALPIGVVLTLPATGSEMNNGAVITRQEYRAKLPFSSFHVYPRFAVLDPSVSFSLPPEQISNGVIDSFVHVIEQYLTYPVRASAQDRCAEGILLTLIEEGPKALEAPLDYDVRANLMWCSTLALNGWLAAGVPQDWATHMVGHEITALFGIDHARTLAIVLPAMLEVRREAKRAKLLQYGERVWGLGAGEEAGDEDKRITSAINKTRAFFEVMNVRTSLSDYGIKPGDIPQIIDHLEAHRMVNLGEKRDVTPDMVRRVLEHCL